MDKKWIAGWGADRTHISADYRQYVKDVTFRYVIFSTVPVLAVRLHFSSLYNTEDVEISEVRIAKTSDESSLGIVPETEKVVTFGGKKALFMKAGTYDALSDEIEISLKAGESLSVSMYFEKMTETLTGQANANTRYIKKYYARGNHVSDAVLSNDIKAECSGYVFLNTADFLTTDSTASAIVAFGDSITALHWPDCLAHRLFHLGVKNRAVIRRGIGGNRVLREYKTLERINYGEAGVVRFETAIDLTNADRVFVLHGINDLIHPTPSGTSCPMSELPTTEELIDGFKKYIEIAHKHGMKIYFATVLPCAICLIDDGQRERIRLALNEWIRTNQLADGFVDFEKAVRDPMHPEQIAEDSDCGDHLHPSFNGAIKLAGCIPEEYLR